MNDNTNISSHDLVLIPFDNQRLLSICGKFDEHLHQIETRLHVEISNRGNSFHLTGELQNIIIAEKILKQLYEHTAQKKEISPKHVHLLIQQETANNKNQSPSEHEQAENNNFDMRINTPMGFITPRTKNQINFVKNIQSHDINFGIGPAGTGKTFLAVACAVMALELKQVRRIILVRPIVEAGERLGFLPGDISQKIDPYLRPLYDALFETLGEERVNKLLEQHIIEIAPLAYMRGRTLNDAFIILDEGQNTTVEQMKMFLTRIGFSSTVVVTGDTTQVDLPKITASGLKHAISLLQDIKTISFSYFYKQDVIRHPIVQEIIEAYEKQNTGQKALP